MNNPTRLNVVKLPINKGLGNALRVALDHCSNEYVARMDSDDLSFPYRFQKQLEAFMVDPSLDIVGGTITEFVGEPENIIGERTVKLTDADIKKDMKKRCAMNHVSVMYKKNAVQNAGGYLDWYYNEDYYLWIRMVEHNCRFANVPYSLVNVRTGLDMSSRRGGWKYFTSERKLQTYMLKHRFIGPIRYVYNVAIRFVGEYVVSDSVRQKLFRFFRSEYVPQKDETVNNYEQEKKENNYPAFSVAMSVYKNDNPVWLDNALESLLNQSVQPSEVVLVVDGPIPEETEKVICKYASIWTS